MQVHKVLRGPNAGLYLPLGMSRLRALHAIHGPEGYFQEKFNIGGYSVEVQQAPPFGWVRIIQSGGAYFEFFATGKPVFLDTYNDIVSGPGTTYKAAVVGTDISIVNKAVSTSPQINKGKRFTQTAQASVIGQEQQVNMANEPNACITVSPNANSWPKLIYESWSPMHSNTGVFLRSYNLWPNVGGGFSSNCERDVNYDVSWAYSYGKQKMKNAYLFGPADWPRASGLQVVQSAAYGAREFAILVDAFSQFWVFPTSAIPANQNGYPAPDGKYVKGFVPSWPSWVFHATQKFKDYFAANGTTDFIGAPDLDWKLHPDGTKACCIVYKRTPVVYDSAFFAGLPGPTGSPSGDFATTSGQSGYAGSAGFSYPGDATRYLVAPGLVEQSIVITITGPNPENFTVSSKTTVLRDPDLTPYATFLAGYVWHNVIDPHGNGKTLAASRGDLCVVDIEFYWDVTNSGQSQSINFVKNLTTGKDITTVGLVRFTDFDMKTLSFSGPLQTASQYTQTCNLRPGYPPSDGHSHLTLPATTSVTFTVAHPQFAVYVFGKFRQILYPAGIPDAQKLSSLTQQAPAAARAAVASLSFIPLNDSTDWSSLTNLRSWMAMSRGYTSGTYSLSTRDLAFYNSVLNDYDEMQFISAPRFGFYYYSGTICNRMRKHPRSILFAHPNGSWAVFDMSTIYNKNGVCVSRAFYDTLSMFDPAKLSIALIDHVHLELTGGTALETSFIELYNKALTNSTGANTITDTFQTLSAADFAPTFTAGTYAYTIPSGLDTGAVVTWLELAATYNDGKTYYMQDPSYQTGAPLFAVSGYNHEATGTVTTLGGGNLFDQTLDAAWMTGPGFTGNVEPPTVAFGRKTFSTPTLIAS